MLNQLIESKNHHRENARKNSFLFATFGVLTAVLVGGWTYSLFAKSYGVGSGDFEMANLIAPVMVENEAPPPKPERPERNVSKASNKVVLEDLYEDLDRSGVPDESMGKKNVITARQYGIDNVVKGLKNQIPEGVGRTGGNPDQGCGLCEEPTAKKPAVDEFNNVVVKPKATPDPTPKVARTVSLGVVNGNAISLPETELFGGRFGDSRERSGAGTSDDR
ncbi:MAG: hypothetical protein IPK58_10110 [Acidobacteria bacterium]|nr:hypothetical protein [Acidobacteriota bacterium]